MIIIRSAQCIAMRVALGGPAREAMLDGVVEDVQRALSPMLSDLPPQLVEDRVRWALERGMGWGFQRRIDLLSFATLVLGIGPGLENHPWARELFEDHTIPAEEKLDVLMGRLTPRDWEDVREGVPPADWPKEGGYC